MSWIIKRTRDNKVQYASGVACTFEGGIWSLQGQTQWVSSRFEASRFRTIHAAQAAVVQVSGVKPSDKLELKSAAG